MPRYLHILLVAALVLLAGCSSGSGVPSAVSRVLRDADTLELYSLDPDCWGKKEPPADGGFHGFEVLGKTRIDNGSREGVVAALEQGAREPADVPPCFFPRHGIRATHRGETVDLVICFQCAQVRVYRGEGESPREGFRVSESPQPALDGLLRQAGVTLANSPMP